MIVFPAVDIKDGKAVRLLRGDKNRVTVYADDPLELARRWADAGANWLHIVDLDGAFAGASANREAITRLAALPGVSKQIGGGIRDLETAEAWLAAGATRLITGTIALEDPLLFRQMCREFPGRIGVSLDAANGVLKSRGWVKDAGKRAAEVIPEIEDAGAAFIIYTDIDRDGARSGVNIAALASLLELTGLPVIAAGGVANLADIASLYPLAKKGLEGAISGRALCEGALDLSEAIAWLNDRA